MQLQITTSIIYVLWIDLSSRNELSKPVKCFQCEYQNGAQSCFIASQFLSIIQCLSLRCQISDVFFFTFRVPDGGLNVSEYSNVIVFSTGCFLKWWNGASERPLVTCLRNVQEIFQLWLLMLVLSYVCWVLCAWLSKLLARPTRVWSEIQHAPSSSKITRHFCVGACGIMYYVRSTNIRVLIFLVASQRYQSIAGSFTFRTKTCTTLCCHTSPSFGRRFNMRSGKNYAICLWFPLDRSCYAPIVCFWSSEKTWLRSCLRCHICISVVTGQLVFVPLFDSWWDNFCRSCCVSKSIDFKLVNLRDALRLHSTLIKPRFRDVEFSCCVCWFSDEDIDMCKGSQLGRTVGPHCDLFGFVCILEISLLFHWLAC